MSDTSELSWNNQTKLGYTALKLNLYTYTISNEILINIIKLVNQAGLQMFAIYNS